jgi:hypothetical protein
LSIEESNALLRTSLQIYMKLDKSQEF